MTQVSSQVFKQFLHNFPNIWKSQNSIFLQSRVAMVFRILLDLTFSFSSSLNGYFCLRLHLVCLRFQSWHTRCTSVYKTFLSIWDRCRAVLYDGSHLGIVPNYYRHHWVSNQPLPQSFQLSTQSLILLNLFIFFSTLTSSERAMLIIFLDFFPRQHYIRPSDLNHMIGLDYY